MSQAKSLLARVPALSTFERVVDVRSCQQFSLVLLPSCDSFLKQLIIVLITVIDEKLITTMNSLGRLEYDDIFVIPQSEIRGLLLLNTMGVDHHWGMELVTVKRMVGAANVVWAKRKIITTPRFVVITSNLDRVTNNKNCIINIAFEVWSSLNSVTEGTLDSSYFAKSGHTVTVLVWTQKLSRRGELL